MPRATQIKGDAIKRVHAAGESLMMLSNLHYQGFFVSTRGYESVHVMEFGTGPPVVLIHGAGGGGPVWHRQIAALSTDHRVIVPDIPMFGISGMPNEISEPMEQIADLILGVMDETGVESADIAGHSLGALGTLTALIRAPDRFNRAVVMSPPGFGRGLNFMLRLASVPALQRFINYGSRRSRYWFFDHFEAQKSGSSEERERLRELHFQVGNRDDGIDVFHRGLSSFTGILGQRAAICPDLAAKIKSPTLLLWGDSDRIIPTKHSKRAVALIPDVRLEIIENCGHILQLEAPQRVTQQMIDWFRMR